MGALVGSTGFNDEKYDGYAEGNTDSRIEGSHDGWRDD